MENKVRVIDGLIRISINGGNEYSVAKFSSVLGGTTLSPDRQEKVVEAIRQEISGKVEISPYELGVIANNKIYAEVNRLDSNIIEQAKNINQLAGITDLPQVEIDPSNEIFRQGAVPYNPNKDNNPNNIVEQTRQIELAKKQNYPNPKQQAVQETKTGSLQHIVGGSDLSVFIMAEVPSVSDVADTTLRPHMWKKELILIELDSVMSLGYSIVRDTFPVRSIGKTKPKFFTRGGTTIAGFLSFTIFTDDVLVRMRTQLQKGIQDLTEKTKQNIDYVQSKLKDGLSREKVSEIKEQLNLQRIQYNTYNKLLNYGNVYMLNQLLPFHILVMGTNEQGNFTKMMLKGVRIIDENQMQGVQQPNIVNKVTFGAEDIFPMVSGNADGFGNFSSTSDNDINNISSNQFSIYSGSQVMNDISLMQQGSYRLKG